MEYTWNIKINKIVPYNIESQQRDLIQEISWTITGTKNGKSATLGGALDYNVEQGVSADSFTAITSINKTTLQSWVETRVGSTRLNEMKAEIEATIDAYPDGFNITPEA
jgi:hypothetical protein